MSRQVQDGSSGGSESLPHSGPGAGDTSGPVVQPTDRTQLVAICILLALAVWAVFGQTLRHEFVNFDDNIYVTGNFHVISGLTWHGMAWAFSNLEAGFWHPLTWLSLMMDSQLYGPWAGGYHLTNALFHAVNTLLLFALLWRLTGELGRSVVVAALFACHPCHVESVAWVSARKDVLSTMFWMLTLWFYAGYADAKAKHAKFKAHHYTLALFFFICGLMSKAMVVTLPVVMLLLDYWPLRRLDISIRNFQLETLKRLIWEKSPFFGLAFAGGLLTIHAEEGIGALADGAAHPIHLRAANAALSGVHYLLQSVWPSNLAALYPYPRSFPMGLVFGSFAVLTLMTLAVLWVRSRRPYLAVGWFWYLVTLAPVSGLIQVGNHPSADRYTYVPLIGIFLMGSWGLADLCDARRYRCAVKRSATAVILIAMLVVAHIQTSHWRNSVSLWSHTLACTPENYEAHNSLGHALAARGRLNEAIQQYERTLQLRPNYAYAHYNLANALAEQRRPEEAVQHYERAIQLQPENAEFHNNFGLVLAVQGKFDDAVQHYERALHFKPDDAKPCFNLGNALAAQGKVNEAIQLYERAIQLGPNHAEAHNNLGSALTAQGKLGEALQHFERAIQYKPDFAGARFNLGIALAARGNVAAGIQHLNQALQLATAQTNAALAQAILKRLESFQSAPPPPQTP